MSLVIVGATGGREVEDALAAFEAAGFTRTRELTDSEPNRVLAVAGGGAETLSAADDLGVRYLLVHVGVPDGQPGGTHERAHHRVELAQLPELADRVRTRDRMLVTCVAFGYKHGMPPEAAWVADVRFLDNPYWVPELRPLTGLDEPVREYVLGQPAAVRALDGLAALLGGLLDEYARRGRMELTVAFGCTGGRHRSVAMAAEMARRLEAIDGIDVRLRLREVEA
jgi:hypothetical protein